MSMKYQIIIPGSLATIAIFSGAILASNNIYADDVVDEVNITVPVSCSLSGAGMNTHNAEITNGTVNSAIGETILKAYCNDNNGFAIYAIGYTDNEDGKNVLTNSSLGDTHDIVAGTATGPVNNVDISQWAMKLSTVTDPAPTYPIVIAGSSADTDKEQGDSDYSTFQAAPDDYALVAKHTSGTDIGASAEGATLKTTYQAYISKTQPAGTYTGQVKYTLVHPNDGTAPTKPISIESAMQTAGKTKQNGYYKMQDLNNTICSMVNIIEADGMTELIDVRDNIVYKVTKLKDGNCWMLNNLALDPTDPVTAANMNASNTNATQSAIDNLLSGGSTTTGWSNTAVATDENTGFYSLTDPIINNTSKDELVVSYGPAAVNGQAKVGVYYNFCAASASTFCYAQNSGVDVPDTLIDASQDICPANWRLFTLDYGGEIEALGQEYGYSSSFRDIFSATMSGYYDGFSRYSFGEWGWWWSSTYMSSNDNMFELGISPTEIEGDFFFMPRSLGFSVRCILNH